ncbi:hypothetical protein H8B02_18800 [Bradyrhizobium sp. Pear77]|uniref:hypothetical protein n=1 Tax=Bradyrhizobium altum TaxID=1571202 RepID=UPI001E469807|nr:hypothetical protein [Bradyrhizobium altum]MCC8955406.1 hypothetical protein [Bradyrhizobium altum]
MIFFSSGIARAGNDDPWKTPLYFARNGAARCHDDIRQVEQGQERSVAVQQHWIVRICIFVDPQALRREAIREGGSEVNIDGAMLLLRQLRHKLRNWM